jgi:hypothetical protein
MNDLDVLGRSAGDDEPPTEPVPLLAPTPAAPRHAAPGRPPWRLLVAVLMAALTAVVGLIWWIGAQVGQPAPRPPVAVPTASSAPSALPSPPTFEPTAALPTPPGTATISPAPTLSRPAPPTTSVAAPVPTRPPLPALVRVPGVVGDRLSAATVTLRAAGFRVTSLVTPVRSPRDSRRVVAQFPAAGTLARPGQLVTLMVGTRR